MQATMVMIDNSESTINGDYPPTRWDQQVEAANLIIEGKIADSAQSSVGLGIMAGKRVEILCAPTNNSAKLTAYLFGIPIYGEIRLNEAIKTALLAMKNIGNQRQRIICLIASEIKDTEDQLLTLGKQLKKDAVNLDLVVCGDETLPESQEQRKRIQSLSEGLKSTESSVTWVPTNVPIRDALSSIFAASGATEKVAPSGGAPAGNGGNGDFAVDPNVDPELAMVLEASRKEYEQMMKKANENKGNEPKPLAEEQEDEDAIAERRAIELSLQEAGNVQAELEAEQQKKKQMQTQQPKKEEEKKKQAPSTNQQTELTKKQEDFINEFEKMDEQQDEAASLKKKEEKK